MGFVILTTLLILDAMPVSLFDLHITVYQFTISQYTRLPWTEFEARKMAAYSRLPYVRLRRGIQSRESENTQEKMFWIWKRWLRKKMSCLVRLRAESRHENAGLALLKDLPGQSCRKFENTTINAVVQSVQRRVFIASTYVLPWVVDEIINWVRKGGIQAGKC